VGDMVCKFDPFWMNQIIWLTRDGEQLALECDEREKKKLVSIFLKDPGLTSRLEKEEAG